jgi:hypothetical protein
VRTHHTRHLSRHESFESKSTSSSDYIIALSKTDILSFSALVHRERHTHLFGNWRLLCVPLVILHVLAAYFLSVSLLNAELLIDIVFYLPFLSPILLASCGR